MWSFQNQWEKSAWECTRGQSRDVQRAAERLQDTAQLCPAELEGLSQDLSGCAFELVITASWQRYSGGTEKVVSRG